MLVVHRKAFDDERLNDGREPLSELHCALGIDLVANGDARGPVEMLGVVAFSIGGSYSKISNN